VTQDAEKAGLAFERPPWWDLDRLFERHADRQIVFPDGREVLFLSWTHILTFNLKEGRKEWDLPERMPVPEEARPRREEMLRILQDASWVVIERDRVWVVPESACQGCEIFPEPHWWHFARYDQAFNTWYREFRASHEDRFFEEGNISYVDYAALFTGREMLDLDERTREPYRAWKRSLGETLTAYDRKEMARVARVLQKAVWVVIYDYEWESGLA